MTRSVAVALAAAVVLGACGVADDDAFRDVPADDVPFGLADASTLAPTTTTTRPAPTTTAVATAPTTSNTAPTTTAAPPALFVEALYFVRDGRLVAVVRTTPTPPTLPQVLADLVAGAVPGDEPTGLRTVLEPEHLTDVSAAGGVATVGITAELATMPTGEQQLAVAQLVYTLTAQPGIGQVAFVLDGQPVAIPRSDGSLASGRITRDDLTGVLAPGGAP